jgi:excisionase family DNA binding protein
MRLLTAIEVAEMLRVTEARVYELARRKLLPHIRLGRQVRFSESLLLEWAHRGGTAQNGNHETAVDLARVRKRRGVAA